MTSPGVDHQFAGSIPAIYDKYLVPLIFEPYAADLAERLGHRRDGRMLEIAAGTGAVTRRLASILPDTVSIVATDLNPSMIAHASAQGTSRPVDWRQADAMALPFENESFDTVVCQFGVMFFPDKAKAFAEVWRVLRPGGLFLFNVWDRLEENEIADAVTRALAGIFPEEPPRFLPRTPYGYHNLATIARDLTDGGFTTVPQPETVPARSRADSPMAPAIGFCQGTPLRTEIEARNRSGLTEPTEAAAKAIAERFGPGPVDGKIQALVVAIER